jgi:hypothetical protein
MAIAYQTGDGFSLSAVGSNVTAEFKSKSGGPPTRMSRDDVEKAVKAGTATPEMKAALKNMEYISPSRKIW